MLNEQLDKQFSGSRETANVFITWSSLGCVSGHHISLLELSPGMNKERWDRERMEVRRPAVMAWAQRNEMSPEVGAIRSR